MSQSANFPRAFIQYVAGFSPKSISNTKSSCETFAFRLNHASTLSSKRQKQRGKDEASSFIVFGISGDGIKSLFSSWLYSSFCLIQEHLFFRNRACYLESVAWASNIPHTFARGGHSKGTTTILFQRLLGRFIASESRNNLPEKRGFSFPKLLNQGRLIRGDCPSFLIHFSFPLIKTASTNISEKLS